MATVVSVASPTLSCGEYLKVVRVVLASWGSISSNVKELFQNRVAKFLPPRHGESIGKARLRAVGILYGRNEGAQKEGQAQQGIDQTCNRQGQRHRVGKGLHKDEKASADN